MPGHGQGFSGCAFSRYGIHHRITQFLPLIETTQQRTHMANAVLPKLQRHTGAGRFVRSSAKKHDLAITSDLSVTVFQFLGRDL